MNLSPPPARVVFRDIHGVLQPPANQKRFDHDLVALREDPAERHGPVTQENRHDKPLVFGPYRHLFG